MKSTYLSSVRAWVLWTELPLMLLLVISLNLNQNVGTLMKLYPLIIALIAGILFIPFYFFRLVSISYEEIRHIGYFTPRDSALINEGKVLRIKMLSRGRLKIYLIGHDGEYAGFDWLKPEDGEPSDITMFRGKAFGGRRAVCRVLSYFGVEKDDQELILTDDGFCRDYENVTVSTRHAEDGNEIDIRINVTLSSMLLDDVADDAE